MIIIKNYCINKSLECRWKREMSMETLVQRTAMIWIKITYVSAILRRSRGISLFTKFSDIQGHWMIWIETPKILLLINFLNVLKCTKGPQKYLIKNFINKAFNKIALPTMSRKWRKNTSINWKIGEYGILLYRLLQAFATHFQFQCTGYKRFSNKHLLLIVSICDWIACDHQIKNITI